MNSGGKNTKEFDCLFCHGGSLGRICLLQILFLEEYMYLYRKRCIFAVRNTTQFAMSTPTMISIIADYFKTQPVLKAWLFGSYARGEETSDSDIDILFVPDKSQHFSLFTLGGMYEDLKDLLGCEVDLITDGGLLPFARESADRDKILIYERTA